MANDLSPSARTTTLTRPLRAAIYTRVSQDASGVARSPKEQEAESRADCDRNGWDVVDVYTDNDRSASRHARKIRSDYARLLADIAAGGFDVLVVWEASRLTRDLEAYATLAAACRSAGVRLSYGGKLLDLDNPDDEFTVGLDMLLAQRESGVARKRILRAQRANAEAGRPHGKPVYGYRRIYDQRTGRLLGQEPDPDTAPVIAELFARIAAGETMWSVSRDLAERGVHPQVNAGPWSVSTLHNMLRSRTYLGHRTHHGEVVVRNAWPAIVDEDMFYRVQGVVNDPSRRFAQDNTAKRLLSGLIVCGVCGGRCSYRLAHQRNEEQYRCKQGGHVSRHAPALDAGIIRLLAVRLARPDALDLLTPRPANLAGAQAERAALTARLDEADEALADGNLSARAHGKLEARVRPRLDELDALLRVRHDIPAPLVDLAGLVDPDVVADRFGGLDLPVRRVVIRTLFVGLTLRPAPPSRRRPDLGVRFRWAGTDIEVEM